MLLDGVLVDATIVVVEATLGVVDDAVLVGVVEVTVVVDAVEDPPDATNTNVLCGTPGGGGGSLMEKVTANVSGEPEALGSNIVAVAL